MASKTLVWAVLSAAPLAGCVSVVNGSGLTPPSALVSVVRGTVGVPREPVCVAGLKSGRTDGTIHLKEWVFTGLSAGGVDMAIREAAEKGGLRKVYYADFEQTSYLGFVSVFNIVAYGE